LGERTDACLEADSASAQYEWYHSAWKPASEW
jgi:hypothetical protein